MLEEFEAHLRRSNLSENTISSYLLTIRMYQQLSGEITKQNLLAFKGYLIETYKPNTGNKQISRLHQEREAAAGSGKDSAKELLGKCHQRRGLQVFEELPETRRELGMVLCGAIFGGYRRARE